MKRGVVALAVVGSCFGAGLATAQQANTAWVHVRVEEGKKESKVNVNLPLPLLEVALSMAPEKLSSHGRVHIGEHGHGDLSVSDMRRLWKALRESGETELVSVQEKDQTVSIARKGDVFRIQVEEPSRKGTVHVEVPVSVVDLLLGGEGDELDIHAALNELQKRRGDIVRVDDGDSKVHIWIDERM
jgi:hypothetical protein